MKPFNLHNHRYLVGLAFAVITLQNQSAWAEDGSIGQVAADAAAEREQALLERGYILRQGGKDAEALATYREAYALRHDTKALAQMGLASEALGNWLAAHQLLAQALEDRVHPWIQTNRQLLQDELGRIDRILGRLVVVVEPAGASIYINSVLAGVAPIQYPILLDPGPALLEVKYAGVVALRRKLDIQQGELQKLSLRLGGSSPTQEHRAPSIEQSHARNATADAARWNSRGNPIWLGTGIAGAALSLGAIVPWSIANRKLSLLAQACRTDSNCDYLGESKDIRRLDVLTNVMLFSGLGVAAVSTVFYLTLLREKAPTAAYLSTWVAQRAAGVTYRHDF